MRGRATDRVRRRARTAQRDPARKMSAPAGDDVVRRTGPVDGRSTRPRHRSTVGPMVFRGSEAVAAGLLTRGQLRGPSVKRLFRDVYVATQHAMVAPRTLELVGRMRLGLDTDTRQL